LSDVRGPLDARCGAKSIGLFAIQKKSDRKTALWAVVASKLDSRMSIVLLRSKSEGGTTECHERTTEGNKGLSVVILIQLVITLLPYRFHEAANQFFSLQQQTWRVLVEVLLARNLGFQLSVLLHRPPSHLIQNRKPVNRKDLARCGKHRLWPLLHVGLSSARWLRSKPPELEATTRHPVGHL
jgi:hypothetical protein